MVDGAFSEIAETLSGQCQSIEKLLLFTPPHSASSAEWVDDFCASADDSCQWRAIRREFGRRAVLQIRDDGRSQGRVIFAPVQRAAHPDVHPARCAESFGA